MKYWLYQISRDNKKFVEVDPESLGTELNYGKGPFFLLVTADEWNHDDDKLRKRKALLESMRTRPFWHYCEVCGKKEFLTDEAAFNRGWDYPPKMGFFGMLGPRTCGNCQMTDTLYWKIQTSRKLPIVMEGDLNDKELITWRRIKGEPESLLNEEKE